MGNAFTALVGIRVPIVQAAMGGATSPAFAAAVSNAGGLGTLALGWSPPEAVRAEIRATKALTDRPFGVNLVLTQPQEERLAICLEEGVKVLSFFWGQAGPLTGRASDAGATVLHTASSADQARRSVGDGADAIVAQGWEAGGHVYGRVATLALVPAVVDAVGDLPVLAAGGIADGRGLAAALALGADGVLVGTRLWAAQEALVQPGHHRAIVETDGDGTIRTTVADIARQLPWPRGFTARIRRNAFTERWHGREAELERNVHTEGPRYRQAFQAGDPDNTGVWFGEAAGLVHAVEPAGVIVERMAAEAAERLQRCAAGG